MGLFNRTVSLTIGQAGSTSGSGQNVNFTSSNSSEAPHIEFDIEKSCSTEPNFGKITIYNADNTINDILPAGTGYKGEVIILQGGYEQDVGLLTMFIGSITNLEARKQKPNSTIMLEAHDGYDALNGIGFGKSYEKKTPKKQVLTDAINQTGLAADGMDMSTIGADLLEGGMTCSGPVSTTLDKVTKSLNLRWSIQGNKIKIAPYTGMTPNMVLKAHVLNAGTGMIGSPEKIIDKDFGIGYRVKSLLLPSIEPDDAVVISTFGTFRVHKVTHKGGTYSSDFSTEMMVFSK